MIANEPTVTDTVGTIGRVESIGQGWSLFLFPRFQLKAFINEVCS